MEETDSNYTVIGSEEYEELTDEELADWIDWYGGIFSNYTIVAKVVAFFSAIGSSFIVYKLVFDVKDADDRKKKLDRSYDRLLLCLCVSDFMSSTAIFLGSWSIPANPSIEYENDVYDYFSDWEISFGVGVWDEIRFAFAWDDVFPQAAGTTGTCTAQGWFWFIGTMTGVIFTGSISLCFLFQVKFQWREQRMRIAEKVLFAVSTLIPLAYSFYALANGGFRPNPALGWCAPVNDGVALFTSLFSTAVLVVVIITLGMLYWTVRTQELRAARWSTAAASGRNQKQVFVKSMLYISAFMFLFGPPFAVDMFAPKYAYYAASFCYPIQGVLNALIYTDMFRNAWKHQASRISSSIKSSLTGSFSSQRSFRSRRKSSSAKGSLTSSQLTNSTMFSSTTERRDASILEDGEKNEGVITISKAFEAYVRNDAIDTGSADENKMEKSEVDSVEQKREQA